MPIDFSDATRRTRLAEAATHISKGYGILAKDLGSRKPSDNGFLREALICAKVGLIWNGQRGGVDAIDPKTRAEVEIKSTQLALGAALNFPTSRYVSPEVIRRFRAAGYWLFGVFDALEQLVALYRVDAPAMAPHLDVLERDMLQRQRARKPLANNPKLPLDRLRPGATRLFLATGYSEDTSGGRCRIR